MISLRRAQSGQTLGLGLCGNHTIDVFHSCGELPYSSIVPESRAQSRRCRRNETPLRFLALLLVCIACF